MKRLLLALFIVASLILPIQGNAGLTVFGGFLPCTTDDGTTCTTSRYISTPGIYLTGLTSGYIPKAGTGSLLGNSLLYQSSYAGFWNGTSNAKNTYGFTINQLAADDEIISLKSSDVSHPFTSTTESDTYGFMKKLSADNGGLYISGLSDAGTAIGTQISGFIGASDPTDTVPAVNIVGLKSTGGTSADPLGAAETVFRIQNSSTTLASMLGAGNFRIGAAGTAALALGTTGNITSGTYQYGISADNTMSGTTQSNHFYAGGTVKSATTVSEWNQIKVDNVADGGSGAAITTLYGLNISALTRGGTNWGVSVGNGTPSKFGGTVYINDTSNSKMSLGLTINQSSYDDEIISLKSSDVDHGFTTDTEADTYGSFVKSSALSGGLSIYGYSDGDATGLILGGRVGSADPTDTTPAVIFYGQRLNGTTVGALGATETAFSFQNSTTKLFTILGGGSAILGTSTAVGTSGAKVFMIDSGTAPTTSPADSAQMWVADFGGTAGKASIHARDEAGNITILGNSNITAGSGTGVTVNYNGHLNRQVYKVTTTYAAYADTDTKKGIVIATLPAKMKIVGCYADTTATYTGGTVSASTLRVGVTAEDAAGILADHDVKTAAVTKGLADADMGTSMTRAAQIQGGYLPSWTGTTAIYATINTTNGNTNALTAGSTTFYIVTEQF